MGYRIILDAGHGGSDPGAVNGARHESDDVLRLAKAVRRLLEEEGIPVRMTREADVHVSLNTRTVLANGSDADLFVSLHRNSFNDPAANGVEVWIDTKATAAEEAAAKAVLHQLVSVGVQSNRGVKRGNYHVLRETKMPSMLVELGFLSNGSDNKLFDERFDGYAKAVADGILEVLGLQTEAVKNHSRKACYKVQVGAFTNEENARAFLEDVREMGLDAFLVLPDPADQS